MSYTRYHFLLDLLLTALLGVLIRVIVLAFSGYIVEWWLCFLLAALVVFLGTFVLVSISDGGSGVSRGSGRSFLDDLF